MTSGPPYRILGDLEVLGRGGADQDRWPAPARARRLPARQRQRPRVDRLHLRGGVGRGATDRRGGHRAHVRLPAPQLEWRRWWVHDRVGLVRVSPRRGPWRSRRHALRGRGRRCPPAGPTRTNVSGSSMPRCDLWRGPPLVEFADAEWAVTEARRLQTIHDRVTTERFDILLGQGRHDDCLVELASGRRPLAVRRAPRRAAGARPLSLRDGRRRVARSQRVAPAARRGARVVTGTGGRRPRTTDARP